MSIIFKSVNIKLENYYQIKLNCYAQGEDLEYAYYVYKDEEVVEKFPYDGNSSFLYNLSEEGSYRVRTYIRDKSGNKIAKTSKTIDFKGFDQPSIQEDPLQIVIYGVSKTSLFIKSILEKRYKVLCFVDDDENKVGDEFFGLKVINLVSIKDLGEVNVIISNPYSTQLEKSLMSHGINNYEFFNFSLAPNNLVIKIMYDQSAIELYRISRFCYQNGLKDEAEFIQSFIQFKFNSFIPYTAEIAEGTRFGYGAVGMIIHKKAKIGKNCVISQNVTIGSKGPLPIIGDNVYIAPGSKCIGGQIGNNVVIGANSVVTKEIPDNCVVAGVPAKIVSTDMEKYQNYFRKK